MQRRATDKPESLPHNNDERIPVYLLPLEWLHWPIRALPDPIVSALGTVAIATLINAAALLVYVLRFRHK
jgi:hypothetical protein